MSVVEAPERSKPQVQFAADGRRIYEPDGLTLAAFLWDRSEIAIIRGPWGCLSGDTEVLTPGGWVRMDCWLGGKIAEWSPESGEICWRVPRGFVDEPCDEMWSFRNDHSLSMMLSDEHRVPYFTRDGVFKVKRADEFAAHLGRNRVPVSFSAPSDGGIGWSEARIRLMVAIAADGHVPDAGRQLVVSLRKDRKKERLTRLFRENGVEWSERVSPNRPTETVYTFDREGWSKGLGAEWWRASRRELEILLDEAMHWDGSLSKGEFRFSTTRLDEAEIVQFAAHATGRRATISCDGGKKDWSPCFSVQITAPGSAKASVWLRGDNTSVRRVSARGGRKYCFVTETGFFVARHDRRVFVTGNSGTSSACCQRIWQHATEQNVGSDGYQRSRWFVMRESYPKLETTTLETWKYWFPERLYGKLYTGARPYRHEVRVGRLVLDVWFGSYDDLNGDSIFFSLEPTGWWWNEVEFIGREAFFSGHGRVGRFPPVIEGGSKWSGSIADLNAPPENHWLPMMSGEVALPDDMPLDERAAYQRPPGMAYFVQPPAVIPEKDASGRIQGFSLNSGAENLKWLRHEDDSPGKPGERYYARAQIGKSHRWIRKNLGNEILPMVEGDPVWPGFDDMVHVARSPLEPVHGVDVWIGLDFGRNPAAVFGQTISGQHQVQFDAAMKNAGASRFAPEVRAILARYYPWVMGDTARAALRAWGDPKGDDGTQTDERTAYDIFRANGIVVRAPPSLKQNNILTRIEAVEQALDRAPGGRCRLMLSPRARRLKMAMAGGYRYPREKPSPMAERKPVKDPQGYSDVADSLQYAMLGEGEGRSMIGITDGSRPKPVVTRAPRRSLRRGRRG